MTEWKWLADIEQIKPQHVNEYLAPDLVSYNLSPDTFKKLISCIRELRRGLQFYSNFEESKCVCSDLSFVANTDPALKALAVCIEGKFEP